MVGPYPDPSATPSERRRRPAVDHVYARAMPLYLVRHAKAGSRASWRGEDEDRPLSKTGRSQANRLAKWFAEEEVSRVLSSPYPRWCRASRAVAERHGCSVEPVAELSEGTPSRRR